MGCLSCGKWGSGPLCTGCRSGLRPVAPRRLEPGVLVHSPFLHEGPARRLVHRLKYEGLQAVASVLAAAMAPHVPPGTSALIPVPRVVWRRIRYGIDPGLALATALASITAIPVVAALTPTLLGPAHAGRSRSQRRPPIFSVGRRPPPAALLVDDVVTTGTTIAAAARVLRGDVVAAVTATAATGVTSLAWGARR